MILKRTSSFICMLAVAIVCLVVGFFAPLFECDTNIAYAVSNDTDELPAIDRLVTNIDIVGNYRLDRTLDVAYGKVYKLQQTYNGMDVYGAELSIAVNNEGNLLSKNGEFKSIKSAKKGDLTLESATNLLESQFGVERIISSRTVVYPLEGGYVYAYEIICVVDGNQKFILSQMDGSVLYQVSLNEGVVVNVTQQDLLDNEVTIPVELDKGTYWMMDYERNMAVMYPTLVGYSMYGSSTDTFEDLAAVSAWNNVIRSYDYWADASNVGVSIRGVNGKKMLLYVFMHYGNEYENAAYVDYSKTSGYVAIEIGDGKKDGDIYLPARSLDTLGHEYTHGITSYTAGLEYVGQSGALNEAFSDIFGALIEGNDPYDFNGNFWKIGEYAVPEEKDCLRSLIGGTNGQRYTKDTMWTCENWNHFFNGHDTSCDYNGVHWNSTVITHVQYLINQYMPEYFTGERIGKLWYATLCMLNANSDFDDFSEQFVQSAVNLGYDSSAIEAINKALYDNGLITSYIEPQHSFTVRFRDANNNVIKEEILSYGESATPPAAPEKPSTQEYDYEFTGWSGDYNEITCDTDFTPVYQAIRCYTVTLMCDGVVLDRLRFRLGSEFSTDIVAERASTKEYTYTFIGWDRQINRVNSDVTLNAIFRTDKVVYTITYVNEGSVYLVQEYYYGEEIVLPQLENRGMKFLGWFLNENTTDGLDGGTVTADMTLYAGWKGNTVLLVIVIVCVVAVTVVGVVVVVIVLNKKKKQQQPWRRY